MSTRLGSLALDRGDFEAAEELFRVAVELARELGVSRSPRRPRSTVLASSTVSEANSPRRPAAIKRRAALAERFETTLNVVLTAAHLGRVAEAAGDLDEARRWYGEALAMAAGSPTIGPRRGPSKDSPAWLPRAGDGELTAMLLGHATHLRGSTGRRAGTERFDVDRAERSARTLLGDDGFERALNAGRALDSDALLEAQGPGH